METKLHVENEDILEDSKIVIKTDDDTFYMNILCTVEFNDKNYVLLFPDDNEDELLPMEYNDETKELNYIDEDNEDLMNYLNEVVEAINNESEDKED